MKVGEVTNLPAGVADHLRETGVEELYPPQADAVEAGVTEGASLVASVPTASGKTLIATLAMLSAIERGGKALYIVPLRALAAEKREEFARFEDLGVSVGMSIGDYESTDDWLGSKDIVVATSEKVDSLVRNGADWIDDLTCVVADEVHLVDDAGRGPTLEVTLAKLRRRAPDLQVVALSATVGNAQEIAEWLDAGLVDSDWRPIDLRTGVYYGNAINFDDGEQYELPQDGKQTETVVRDTLADEGSTLVFVNSRRNAEAAARRLADVVEPMLGTDERRALEDVAAEIRDVSDTETSHDLAAAVEQGAAFHHAGLCVTGDTQILRPDGTLESIRDVVEAPAGGAMGLDGFSVDSVDITDTFSMGEREVLRITTRTGNTIDLSRTHPLPVLSEDGLDWVQAGTLEAGTYIASPRRLNIDPDPPSLRELVRGEHRVYRQYGEVRRLAGDAEEVDIENRRLSTYGRNRNIRVDDFKRLCREVEEDPTSHLGQIICTAGQKPVSMPRHISADLCWLAGAVAGDGYVNEKGVHLTGISQLVEEFESIVNEHFERDVTMAISSSGTPSVSLNSKLVADLFVDHFGIPRGVKSGQLEIPKIPLPDYLIGAYVSGLFDTDGSISPRSNADGSPCIEFYSTSETLIQQLKVTLLRFGILAFRDIREVEGRVTHLEDRSIASLADIHRLTIYGMEQLRQFQDLIGFRHPVKSRKLTDAIEKNPRGGRNQNDVIPPGLGTHVREARMAAGLSMEDLEPDVPKATLSRYENGKTPIRRETFRRLAGALDDELLERVATSDIYWDRVESIEKVDPEQLYDLSTSTGNFVANGIIAHNTSNHRSLIEDAFRERNVKVVAATPTLAAGVNTPSRRVVVRDWRRYDASAGGMQPLSTLEVHQMFGRAGRPGLDPYGEAVLLASSHDEMEELFDRYIWADPEPVRSKLAAEPALRTHVLATVATGFATTRSGLLDFLDETLYATQTPERGRIASVTDTVLDYLEANDFVERDGDDLRATSLGHTVSRLYLDPMSAAEIIDGLRRADDALAESGESPTAMGLYHLVSRTPDMYQLYLRSGDRETYTELAYEREAELPGRAPSEFEDAWEDWLSALKTAKLLEDWADELDEDRITTRYGVGPGDVRGKVDVAEWLLSAAERLASELDLECVPAVREARMRVEHGVREELLDLVSVGQVGRKRARRLHRAGVESPADLREAPKGVVLRALEGRRKTAETVLRNAGRPDPEMDDVEPAEADAVPGADGAAADAGSRAPTTEESATQDGEQAGLGDFG